MKFHLSYLLVFVILITFATIPVSARLVVTGGNIDIAQTITPGDVSAFSYTCVPQEKIAIMEYDIPINTVVNFTYTYGTGATVSGWMIYRPAGIVGQSYSEVSIGGNTYSETFIDAQVAGYALVRHIQFVSYARNSSTSPVQIGFAVYSQGYGLYSNEIAFYPVSNIAQNMIYGVSVSASQPVKIIAITNDGDKLAKFVGLTVGESVTAGILEWLDRLWSYIEMIWSVFMTAIYWLKFIFIDNIVLTFALYLSGTMAYSALTAKNVFDFYKRFFGLQKTFFEFMISAFNTLIQMITSLINTLKPL